MFNLKIYISHKTIENCSSNTEQNPIQKVLIVLKKEIRSKLHDLAKGKSAEVCYHPNAKWWGSSPFDELQGHDAINGVWQNIRTALPDLERRDSIFLMGRNVLDDRVSFQMAGNLMVASICHYQGTFLNPLCGIPANNKVVHLRSCEVHKVVDDKIAHSFVLIDFLDLMNQVGLWPLVPSLGSEGHWPGPATSDGVMDEVAGLSVENKPIEIVLSMHQALHQFDGKNIASMPMDEYWTPNFQYYAASGIGTTRGLTGFRCHHQIPFLKAFPDRKGAGHFIRISEGNFAVTGGWPSVEATHKGEWLGLPGTGRKVGMRVMDFYRLENNKIAENWVPIDIIHVLNQMGFDVFARLKHILGAPKRDIG